MIILDYKDRRPINEQVFDQFKKLILSGVLKEGESMPSVRSLATSLAVNPNTVQRAYARLEQEGYIYTVSGKGSFIAVTDSLLEQQQLEWFRKLKELLTAGALLNISKENIEACIHNYPDPIIKNRQ